MGIEPTSSAWKADILADVLYLQRGMAYSPNNRKAIQFSATMENA